MTIESNKGFYESDETTEVIGAHCTLFVPYKGYTDGMIVGDYGNRVVVHLDNGTEVVEYRDELIIYD